jgi:hypothetical protein
MGLEFLAVGTGFGLHFICGVVVNGAKVGILLGIDVKS